MTGQPGSNPLELWGGVECTVNRVGDRYHDQLECTGHARRLDDLDRIASLGIRTVRYPILWERTEVQPGRFDWAWSDERLQRLRELGIDPIVGLVHHGSGPAWTSLLQDSFVDGLADFAERVADRYPWLRQFTIVNEPLTTARFSGLYGHWFPHARSDAAFVKAFLIQCRAIVVASQRITRRIPQARFVQTEDVSTTWATAPMHKQAKFYRRRAWLTFDVLCGRLRPTHGLYRYLAAAGMTHGDIDFFLQGAVPPDVLGLNYYVASDRFLDHEVERYPPGWWHQGRHGGFVDVDAARTPRGIAGHYAHLARAWRRYRRPLAFTEVHLDCTAEQQMRWFVQAWDAAGRARRADIPVVAVTAWGLFGLADWNSLVTRFDGYVERGAFDVRPDAVRPRALASLLRQLPRMDARHPASAGTGWWRSADQLQDDTGGRPILLVGDGPAAEAVAHACVMRGLKVRHLRLRTGEPDDLRAVVSTMTTDRPWAVISAVGVRGPEAPSQERFRRELEHAAHIAAAAADHAIPTVVFSSSLVFSDGTGGCAESANVGPATVAGETLVSFETDVRRRCPRALIVRTGICFDSRDRPECLVPAGPALTYLPDLAAAVLELVIDGEEGIWHLTNEAPEHVSERGSGMPTLASALERHRQAWSDHQADVASTPSSPD